MTIEDLIKMGLVTSDTMLYLHDDKGKNIGHGMWMNLLMDYLYWPIKVFEWVSDIGIMVWFKEKQEDN